MLTISAPPPDRDVERVPCDEKLVIMKTLAHYNNIDGLPQITLAVVNRHQNRDFRMFH
jgi:hypothetical protein